MNNNERYIIGSPIREGGYGTVPRAEDDYNEASRRARAEQQVFVAPLIQGFGLFHGQDRNPLTPLSLNVNTNANAPRKRVRTSDDLSIGTRVGMKNKFKRAAESIGSEGSTSHENSSNSDNSRPSTPDSLEL
jgi:hypothetical protein